MKKRLLIFNTVQYLFRFLNVPFSWHGKSGKTRGSAARKTTYVSSLTEKARQLRLHKEGRGAGFHLQGPEDDCVAGVVIAHLAHQRAGVWDSSSAFSPALGGQTGSLGLLQEQAAGQTLLCRRGRQTLAGAAW